MRVCSSFAQTFKVLSALLLAGTSVAALTARAEAQQVLEGIVIEGATLDAGPPVSGDGGGATGAAAEDDTDSDAVADASDGVTPGIPSEKIGSPVAVVTRQQLEAQKVRHAGEALRSLPGVHVSQSGSFGGVTQVRIRGAEANHTKVLIDGIEAGTTNDNEFDFSNLLTHDIERIEVIRGGHSGIYGSEAIGGVINIVTRDGRGPITAEVAAEGLRPGRSPAVCRVARMRSGWRFPASTAHRTVSTWPPSAMRMTRSATGRWRSRPVAASCRG